jgi:hypothetical protein
MLETESTWQALCASSQLQNGGQGWRFVWEGQPAFAVRHQNQVYVCVAGPCRGQRLQPIALIEKAEVVYYQAQLLPVI